VTKDQVHLARNGDDLVVTVGSYRRLMTLPQALARLRIAGARVESGELQVRFVEGSTEADGRPQGAAGGHEQETGRNRQ
jgi:arsenite-transporting ATPase